MLARTAKQSDAEVLDRLLDANRRGDVRLERDVIVISGAPPSGVLVWRPAALVHEFECPGVISANALVNYAVGQGAGRVMPIRDVLFVVRPDNKAMLRFAERIGATPQDGLIYSLDVG